MMNNTIETTWKKGFLNADSLIAPKVNDLYNRKSTHVIDKFKRMFRINLWAILLGSIAVLLISFPLHVPVMGVAFFIIMMIVGLVNNHLAKELKTINQTQDSFRYLQSFSDWLENQLSVNRKMATMIYPALFLSVVAGMWYGGHLDEILPNGSSQTSSFLDLPIAVLIATGTITALLALFGAKIYNLDVGLIYGKELKKVNELLEDMEELSN